MTTISPPPPPNILGSQSILTTGASLLTVGRQAFSGSKIGLSGNSRALLEGFFDGATALFNQLYTKTENGEAANVTAIMALRSKYSYLVSDEIKETAASKDKGTNVDKTA